jgi:hypothetical protein
LVAALPRRVICENLRIDLVFVIFVIFVSTLFCCGYAFATPR